MKTKFEIGQRVKIRFTGTVEDQEVVVFREGYVWGIVWTCPRNMPQPSFFYHLSEKFETDKVGRGKVWENTPEYRITALEPVVEAIANAAS